MLTQEQLVIGNWYNLPNEQIFELVAFDVATQMIEVQFYDGTLGELDITDLVYGGAKRCASPVDAGGAYEHSNQKGLSQECFNEQGLDILYQQGFASTANHCGADKHFTEWTGEWD